MNFALETVRLPIQRAFFGPGHWELIIILIIVLVVFGAGKLPTVGSALGKGIRNFRGSLKGEDVDGVAEEKEKTAIEAPKKELEADKKPTDES